MPKLKRYLLFAGLKYYPNGGWEDFIDSYADREEAVNKENVKGIFWGSLKKDDQPDWWQVVDRVTGEVIASSDAPIPKILRRV